MAENTGTNEVGKVEEFRDWVRQHMPSEVKVHWRGPYGRQRWADDRCSYLVDEYSEEIECEVAGRTFSVESECGAIVADGPGEFGGMLEELGYEFVRRYGASGHWVYVYRLPSEEDAELEAIEAEHDFAPAEDPVIYAPEGLGVNLAEVYRDECTRCRLMRQTEIDRINARKIVRFFADGRELDIEDVKKRACPGA